MTQNNLPAKHHYIPAFYTKRWMGKGGLLCEFSRPYKEVKPKRFHPNGTGFVYRLYELRDHPPQEAQAIEMKLKRLDNLASDALSLIEMNPKREDWSDVLRSAWTRFIMSLMTRTPDDVENLRDFWRRELLSNKDMSERYKVERLSGYPATFQEYVAEHDVSLLDRAAFDFMLILTDMPKVGALINNMLWASINTSGTSFELLTSDRPVIRTLAIAGAKGHLAIPIGPRSLFLAYSDPSLFEYLKSAGRESLVRDVNRLVVEGAQRYVYGTDDSQLRFVSNRMSKAPQPGLLKAWLP